MPRRIQPSAARKQIASGSLDPLYLIDGDDDKAKTSLAVAFGDVVEPELRGFNVERLHAGESERDSDIADVLTAARTLPFGGGRRVVIVFQAEKLVPRRESEAADRSLEDFAEYLESPVPQSTLVLVAGIPLVPARLAKLLEPRCTAITCSALDQSSDARRWVQSRAAEAGIKIEPAALRKLLERAGEDQARLKEDTERLLLFAQETGGVDVDDVLTVVGPASSKGEWAVVNAIERGATGIALKELALMLDEGAVPVMVLGQLAWYVRNKMVNSTPARVPAAVDALFRTDVGLKSSGGDARLLLERLVIELCRRQE
jgi:DNA polymerase-3 subunit delta